MNKVDLTVEKRLSFRTVLPHIALVIVLILSVCAWRRSSYFLQQKAEERLELNVSYIISNIIDRLREYKLLIRGGSALFIAFDEVTRTQFHDYVETLDLKSRYPGIQEVGFAKYIEPSELMKHVEQVRAEGFPDYAVRPDGVRLEYTSIVYLEPFDLWNQTAFGYDMFSESTRRAAMEKARDTGMVQVSGKVTLVQETDEDIQAGFLMYIPVYKKGMPITSVQERRAALFGYVYSSFRVGNLMKSLFGNTLQDIDLRIYDGDETTENSFMYDSNSERRALSDNKQGLLTIKKVIELYGHQWTLVSFTLPSIASSYEKYQSLSILVFGFVMALLVFLFLRSQEHTREQALLMARDMTSAVRENEITLKRVNRALRTLSLSNEKLMRATDELEFIKEVCRIAVADGGYALAWVGVAEKNEEKTVRVVAQEGFSDGYLEGLRITYGDDEAGRGPTGTAIRTGVPFIVKDIAHDSGILPWKEEAEKQGYRSVVALPLFVHGIVAGALSLYSTEPNDFDEDEVKLLTELATDLGFGITTLRARSAAERSREAQRRCSIAVEQSIDAILITDEKGNIEYANKVTEQIADCGQAELIGKKAWTLDIRNEDETYRPRTWGDALKGHIAQGAILLNRENKEPVRLALTITPVRDASGQITNYVAIYHDVTEQFESERKLLQSQKMEAIGTLAGGIAHDFNNILFAILGYTEMAQAEVPPDSRIFSNLQRVLDAGQRAGEMVKQILSFSRKIQPERKPLFLGPIVKEGLKFLRSSIPTTIEIRENVETDLPTVWADPTQIHQVLMNFCTNAAHAMRDTTGVLSVDLSSVELGPEFAAQHPPIIPGKFIRLTVGDTGHGMEPKIINRIFEPFFTTKKQGEGTGLGLSVVHGIVKSHGGTITVYSELGKGTTFNMFLPVIEAESKPEESEEVSLILAGNERILLVDDEETLVHMVSDMLAEIGYEVTTRTSSRDALELFRLDPQRFDLVITDFTMPEMTGAELARELIAIRPDIPVILCSGLSLTLDDGQINEWGIRTLIRKPILKKDLARAVRKVLDQGSRMDEHENR